MKPFKFSDFFMGDNMEKIVEQGLLYDFYGELLTEHQRQIYEDAVYNDMSLSELASTYGISRQGIHDLLRRCDKSLLEYEEKLHLIERFDKIKKLVLSMNQTEDVAKIRTIAAGILEEL